MNLVAIILRSLASRLRRIRSIYYHRRLIWMESGLHRELAIGQGNWFAVPVRSHGLGRLIVGSGNSFGYWAAPIVGTGDILLQPRRSEAEIHIGRDNRFSNNVSIIANAAVTVGDGCQIGDGVAIYDSDFHEIDPATRNRSEGRAMPVHIGDNVWLGSRVMILKGVTIGNNSIVGAMSLVTKPVPANCVVAGVPARIIRTF